MTDDVNVVKAFVNLDANLSERIELRAGILFRSADSDKLSNALYLPKLEGSFAVKYNSPKFNAKINCDLMGEQFFGENITNETETTTQVVKADSFANLKFDCNFKIYENIFLGIEVDNILNSNIYKFNHYRQLGTNVLAKVNFKF